MFPEAELYEIEKDENHNDDDFNDGSDDDEYINDKKNNIGIVRRIINCLYVIPSLKDVIIVVAKKHIYG